MCCRKSKVGGMEQSELEGVSKRGSQREKGQVLLPWKRVEAGRLVRRLFQYLGEK